MKKLTLLLIFSSCLGFAQDRTIFFGKISDELGELENVHILNLNTNQATSTNPLGEFKIFAKVKDSLKITYVGYETQVLILKNIDFGIDEKQIKLKKEIVELDEIALKKHYLQGILGNDMKQTPEDVAIAKSKGALDFSKIDFEKPVIKKIDEIDRAKAPNMRKVTDPTAKFAGVGVSSGSGPDKYAVEKRATRKLISFKEQFPNKLLSEFGSHFFFEELKIPKDKYHHFLEYCNPLGIEELYKENKKFEVINILTKESKSYLEIIKNE